MLHKLLKSFILSISLASIYIVTGDVEEVRRQLLDA